MSALPDVPLRFCIQAQMYDFPPVPDPFQTPEAAMGIPPAVELVAGNIAIEGNGIQIDIDAEVAAFAAELEGGIFGEGDFDLAGLEGLDPEAFLHQDEAEQNQLTQYESQNNEFARQAAATIRHDIETRQMAATVQMQEEARRAEKKVSDDDDDDENPPHIAPVISITAARGRRRRVVVEDEPQHNEKAA